MNDKTRVFPRLTLLVLTTGVGISTACSQADDPDMGTDTTAGAESTSGGTSASATSSAASSAATSTAPPASSSATSTAATSTAATSTAATSTAATSSATSSDASSSTSSASESTSTAATSSATADGSSSSDSASSHGSSTDASSSDAATSGIADENFEPLEEHFTCIKEWENGPGFRITNVLGHLEEALEVANSETGGTYPVGTIIQHLPTEAMVKRHTGFSAETKDWEFFLLTLSADGATFADRGPGISTTMGQTCVSCHELADAQWDFVCNTSKDHGGTACGTFDFSQMQRDNAADPRCD